MKSTHETRSLWGFVFVVYSPRMGPKGPALVRYHAIKIKIKFIWKYYDNDKKKKNGIFKSGWEDIVQGKEKHM